MTFAHGILPILLPFILRVFFPYRSLEELLLLMDEPERKACQAFCVKYGYLIDSAKGSKSKHQAWNGGYVDHLTETMNFACVLYAIIDGLRPPLPFSLSDVLYVLFWHDVEKIFMYSTEMSEKRTVQTHR